jgi:hypothetical protein
VWLTERLSRVRTYNLPSRTLESLERLLGDSRVAKKKAASNESVWGPEWIPLPSGSRLHRDDLAKWEGRGCWKCGEVVFNIYESGSGVACPSCVRKRTKDDDGNWREVKLYGKFDMITMSVVQTFQVKEGEDNGT